MMGYRRQCVAQNTKAGNIIFVASYYRTLRHAYDVSRHRIAQRRRGSRAVNRYAGTYYTSI